MVRTMYVLSFAMLLGLLLTTFAGTVRAEEGGKDDAAEIAKQVATYPLETCVVSGEKLGGDMGKPVDFLYEGRLVRFCCKGCIKKFKAEPEKYLKMIDEAAGKAKAKESEVKKE